MEFWALRPYIYVSGETAVDDQKSTQTHAKAPAGRSRDYMETNPRDIKPEW
jgi:hypothetical protein